MKTVSKKLLSLLLVAILLVSALPFQAFAAELEGISGEGTVEPLDAPPAGPVQHEVSHESGWLPDGSTGHYKECTDTNCVRFGQKIETAAHDWSQKDGICHQCSYACTHAYTNGVCSICGKGCPEHNLIEVTAPITVAGQNLTPYSAPTCDLAGKNADKYCAYCNQVVIGEPIAATGHSFDGTTCTKCGATARTVTLNPAPGTINGGASTSFVLVNDKYLVNLPKPDDRTDFTFGGWLTANGTIIYPNSTANVTYDASMGTTFTAQWIAKTKHVEVYAVLNGNYSSPLSGYVWQGEAPENGNLLDYLKNNAVSAVNIAVSNNPGYTWDGVFRDRFGNALADGTVNQAQNVYVNFTSVPYKLYFDADGGTVTPTSKVVYKGSKVGTLPTPQKDGKVFMGWEDAAGVLYTSETVYSVATDTMLKAIWKDQAKVYLRVYVNGNTTTPDRLLEIDKFVEGDHIYWATIDTYLRKYYSAAPGSVLVVNGLFDKNTWESYRSNPSQERKNDIRVSSNTGTEIYVMVNGANSGITVLPTNPTVPSTVPAKGFWVRDLNGNEVWYPAGSSLPSGNGYWLYDSNGNPNIWVIIGNYVPTYPNNSNPKTGDTAKIEIAAAVMILAAAALITVMALRKKKSV